MATAAERSGDPARRATATKQTAKRATTKRAAGAPSITISAVPKKKIPVDLIGVRYQVTPPKSSLAIKISQQVRTPDDADDAFTTLGEWIDIAFGKQAAVKVRNRLEDPDDDLDLEHIMQLMNLLMETEAGAPPT